MTNPFADFPEATPALIVGWAFCVFVIWYFYRHAEKKNRVKFVSTLAVVTALFFFIFAYLWQKSRFDFTPRRIAVFPFQLESTDSPRFDWTSITAADLPTAFLAQQDPRVLLAYPLEWLYSAVQLDSLADESYILSLANRIRLDYVVIGSMGRGQGQGMHVSFKLLKIPENKVVFEDTQDFDPGIPAEYGYTASQAILKHLDLNLKNDIQAEDVSIPSEILRTYYRAKENYLIENFQDAKRLFETAVIIDSSCVPCLNMLAKTHLEIAARKKELGQQAYFDLGEAKSSLSKALAIDPNQSTSRRLLGEFYIWNEKWTQAEAQLRKALDQAPFDPATYYDLNKLHANRFKDLGFNNEKVLLRRAIKINPCYFEAYFALAEYYIHRDRIDLAILTVQDVLRINPRSVDGLLALGKYYLKKGDILKVLQTYEKVTERDPRNPDAYYNLGIVYYQSEDYDTAIKFFKRAIQLGDHLNSHVYLAYIYEIQGKMDLAIQHLRTRIRKQTGKDDQFAEEARKHLFQIMRSRGVIDSLMAK